MNIFKSLILILICSSFGGWFGAKRLFAQDVFLKVSAYKSGKEYKFYADNPHPCPVQMQVSFPHIFEITYKHNTYPVEEYLYTIIPPNQKKYHCFSIKLADTTLQKFTYNYHAHFGLPATRVDSNFLYVLPYEIGTKHFVPQGYNGRFSHKNQYALDFKMREKTPIRASRGGMVISVSDTSNKRGRTSEFAKYANFIVILHEDNTYAMYYHLLKNGTKVKLGEMVNQGQIIALSGNTGWTTGAHLHFVVKKILFNAPASTIPTFFAGKNKKYMRVKSWNFYKARY